MKIELPAKYKCIFKEGDIFVSRWKDNSLILMNKQSKERLVKILREAEKEKGGLGAFARFKKAGIMEVEYKNGVVEIPEFLSGMLKGDQRSFKLNSNEQILVIK